MRRSQEDDGPVSTPRGRTRHVGRRRTAAAAALLCLVAAVVLGLTTGIRQSPRGLAVAAVLVVACTVAWEAVLRRGAVRTVGLAAAAALLVAGVVLVLTGGAVLAWVITLALLLASLAAAKTAFTVRAVLPHATRPAHPIVVWNPRSGGGKALSNNLETQARARGIEPIELKPGDDLVVLVRDAVARGADALAAAGGDGTQALVATIAAEHDLPFACIPAGTRNHFALDLGVDRDDVVGALDAFVSGGERRVDLAEVNGRVFVNNVSLGLYAEAVQREGYRDAKLRTILDTVPDVVGAAQQAGGELTWTGPDGTTHHSATVILVSNNTYRLGRAIGSGTRPRLDSGLLGVAALGAPGATEAGQGRTRRWTQWSTGTFEVGSAVPVPAGVDGEALRLEPPLRFVARPGALRVRIAPQHPGASPSAAQPSGLRDTVVALVRLALGTARSGDPSEGGTG